MVHLIFVQTVIAYIHQIQYYLRAVEDSQSANNFRLAGVKAKAYSIHSKS